jgi:TetR/AcrR family transcriptional regulator, regulator of cefoperazone and chloramphenicol sensitivity
MAEDHIAHRGGKTPHGVAQRQELVLAAFHLIAEKGFEGLRTRDVAQHVGVNIATLHYYFPSKEDLIRAVVEYMRERFATIHSPHMGNLPMTPLEEFRADLADVGYMWATEPELYIVQIELSLRGLHDPAIRAIVSEFMVHWHGYVRGYIADGIADGTFRQDLDPDVAATEVQIFMQGMIMHFVASNQVLPADRINAEIEHWLIQRTS